MTFKLYRIKSLDFFSFGGLQNFAAGESSFRSGKFPPEVSRFFHLIDLEKATVTAVLLIKGNELYLPVPADWAVPRKGEQGEVKVNLLGFENWHPSEDKLKAVLPDEDEIAFDTDEVNLQNLPYLEEENIPKREATTGWVPFKVVRSYLEKGVLGTPVKNEQIKKRMASAELKVGLTLEKSTGTAEEHRLYFEFIDRLAIPSNEKPETSKKLWEEVSLGILVLNKEDNFSIDEGYYFIGGETRAGKVEKINEDNNYTKNFLELLNKEVQISNKKLYKFLILSHTFVKEKQKEGIKIGKEIKLTASNGSSNELTFKVKWIFTGGREWLSGFNKPAIEVLQPGTVLVLESVEAPPTEITQGAFLKEETPKVIQNWFKEQYKTGVQYSHFHEYGFNFGFLIPFEKNN